MSNEHLVDVSPDMQFYNLLESYPYNMTGALCEYIDNSLEAYQAAKKNNAIKLPDILKLNNHQLKLVGSYNGLKSGYGSQDPFMTQS